MADINGDVTLAALQVQGEVLIVPLIDGVVNLPALQAGGELQLAPAINGSITLPALQVSATLGTAVSLGGDLTLPALQAVAALQVVPIIHGNITLPALQVSGVVHVALRRALTDRWELSERRRSALADIWAMQTRDAARAAGAEWSLSIPQRAEWVAHYFGPRCPVLWGAPWALRLAQTWQATCGIGVISAPWTAAYGSRAARGWATSYASAAVVRAGYVAAWSGAPVLRGALQVLYGAAPGRRAAWHADWSCAATVRGSTGMVWSLTAGRTAATWWADYEASERARVRVGWAQPWQLQADAADAVRAVPTVAITCAGQAVRHERVALEQTHDDGLWRATVRVLGTPPTVGELLQLELDGDTYALHVTAVQIAQQTPTDWVWEMRAASAPALWPDQALDRSDDVLPFGGMASEIATMLAAPLALTWSAPDWLLRPPVVAAQLHGRTKLQGLRALAAAAGGVLLCSRDSTTLTVVPLAGDDLGTVVALEGSLQAELPATAGARAASHGVQDRIRVDGDGRSRTLWVTPQPWRPVTVRLTGAGTLVDQGEQAVDFQDVVAFVGGVAELAEPVDAIQSVTFSGASAGAVRYLSGERGVWLDAATDAVASINYTSRALRFALSSDAVAVNISVEDSDI